MLPTHRLSSAVLVHSTLEIDLLACGKPFGMLFIWQKPRFLGRVAPFSGQSIGLLERGVLRHTQDVRWAPKRFLGVGGPLHAPPNRSV